MLDIAGIVISELQNLIDLETKAGKVLAQRLRTIESQKNR